MRVHINLINTHQPDLNSDSNEPTFLKKLRGEYGGGHSVRHQHQQLRPRKQRNADDDDDDEPVYVHEGDPSEPISKADYDALVKAPAIERQPSEEVQPGTDVSGSKAAKPMPLASSEEQVLRDTRIKQEMATIGRTSKKRAIKVVGDDALADETQSPPENPRTTQRQGPKKPKKPKLSFQDE